MHMTEGGSAEEGDQHVVWDIIVSPLFEQNCYVVRLAASRECVIIDPGFDPDNILHHLRRQRLEPQAFLITHGHVDHIAGLSRLKEKWPEVPVVTGVEEADKLVNAEKNLSAFFGLPLVTTPADLLVVDGQQLELAGIKFLARQIAGHSRGHLVYFCERTRPIAVFVGDVIFAGSVGRTDFPDGDFRELVDGIQRVLFALPDDTVLLPGHGPATTVGREKATNPYLSGRHNW